MLQDPAAAVPAPPSLLDAIGWVDLTAVAILLVFVVLGLWKGMVWQLSRAVILVAGYGVAGRFAPQFGPQFAGLMVAQPGPADQELGLYLAFVMLFLGSVLVLSLLLLLMHRWLHRESLAVADRLGGGVLGVATGAGAVLFLLTTVEMFFPADSNVAAAAATSRSRQVSVATVDLLGSAVHPDLRKLFIAPALEAEPGKQAPSTPGEPPRSGR